jgi:hypothetical protein
MSEFQWRRIFAVFPDAASVHTRTTRHATGARLPLRPEPQHRVATDDGPQPRLVAATGVLDLASIGDLQKDLYSLIRAGSVRLIVDLSRRCEELGGWLRLAHPVGLVAKVFDIVLLGRDVEIYPTVTAAGTGVEGDRIMR